MQTNSKKSVLGVLVAAAIVLNLLIFGVLSYVLVTAKDNTERDVRVTVENLALLLEQGIAGSLREIELSLREIQAHMQHQLEQQAHGTLTPKQIASEELEAQRLLETPDNWLVQYVDIRILNEHGETLQGRWVVNRKLKNYADQAFFQAHVQDADRGMRASKLMRDPETGMWLHIFSKRYVYPDGRFAGVVFAAVPAHHFERLLTGLKLGEHGIALMRDTDMSLIARVPATPVLAGQVGQKGGSHEVTQIVQSGVREATFYSNGTADGINRTDAYRKLSGMPAFVVVGLGEDDYLAQWRGNVTKALIFQCLFTLMTWVAVVLLWRSMRDKDAAMLKSQMLFQNASDGIHILDVKGVVIEASQAFCKMLGRSHDEVVGAHLMRWESLLSHEQAQELLEQMFEDRELHVFDSRFRRLDGTLFPVEISARALMLDGTLVLMASARDTTERSRAADDLLLAASAFQSQVAMLIADKTQTIVRVNPAFTKVTGYSAEEVVGQTPRMFSSGRHDPEFYKAMWATLDETDAWQGEIWNRRKNGQIYPQAISIGAVRNHQGEITHYVSTFIDITARKLSEEQVHRLAFYDSLTQLHNRKSLLDRLERAIENCECTKTKGALLFIDLDNFKSVNDTVGHYEGDQLLLQVSRILKSCLREEDTVARLGSDEFVVMLEGLGAYEVEAARRAEVVGSQILKALHRTFELGNTEHRNTASIGVALFGEDCSEGVDEPLKRADLAMYQSKLAGGNTLSFFDPKMQADIQARAELNSGLWAALDHKQFFLQYQPQVSHDRRVMGVEALIRWRHPERGLISPAMFIPVAEQNGLIVPLGRWVLETACEQLAAWAKNPSTAHLNIAVNVSARQFGQEGFVTEVMDILKRTGANPELLELELTESSLVVDVESVIEKMSSLREMGVCFSLDDFGTGYSSLTYLKRLPLNKLKIDQGFVRDILDDPNDAAIARTVIVLAESMGLSVIAEGVETEAQRDFLASQGCRMYQGYLFSRPLSIEDLEAFFSHWQSQT